MSAPSSIAAELLGERFRFHTAPGLFSADRVDDGTRLLLEHLPATAPKRVLDLGCGYGALGLPIAARHREARFLLVDRDTLATEYARRNAHAHGLSLVEARPSLGYRDVGEERFDWVLCNVPARIGEAAIAYILGEGARRLGPGGELRVVVIRDLGPVVERLSAEHGWPVRKSGEGARHLVYTLPPLPPSPAPVDHEALYLRDVVRLGGLLLERPHDISEDMGHLREGLPLLLEVLPKAPKGDALVWRGGYGAAAVTLAQRGASVLAVDRDLLATTFTRRNAALAGVELRTRDAFALAEGLQADARFSLVVGEVHPSAGEESTAADLLAATGHLAKGGLGLWLGLTRQSRGWLEKLTKAGRIGSTLLATRGAYTVWYVQPGKR